MREVKAVDPLPQGPPWAGSLPATPGREIMIATQGDPYPHMREVQMDTETLAWLIELERVAEAIGPLDKANLDQPGNPLCMVVTDTVSSVTYREEQVASGQTDSQPEGQDKDDTQSLCPWRRGEELHDAPTQTGPDEQRGGEGLTGMKPLYPDHQNQQRLQQGPPGGEGWDICLHPWASTHGGQHRPWSQSQVWSYAPSELD